ncbi:MAG: hypothetical protein FJ035_08260, partial [Chloroflexi bacterium]|nr:hypothetical protein [Chloroflexota bacterium]
MARLAHPAEIPAECEPPPTRGPLVGRVAEMAELDDALERSRSGACALLLRGVSGIGKTALAESFVRHAAAERGALVLAARCHPYEAIPFRALDGVIDALARHLARLGDDAVELLLPDDVAAVRRIFPVLGRVPRIARAVARRGAGVDPAMDRQESFTALRSLLSRIAAHRPVILWIDDAHCGDRDSAALLGELLRVPVSSRILLLLSFGEEQGTAGPLVEALRGSAAASLERRSGRELQLGPLSVDHVAALVRSVIGDGAPIPAERLAAEAQGSPLLALEVARELAEQRTTGRGRIDLEAPSVVSVIARRVDRLPQVARDVLELLAVASGPLDRAVARRALGAALAQGPTIRGELNLRPALGVELDPRPELRAKLDPRPALALLDARRLARPVPRGDEMADAIDHDRIQEAVLALLPPMLRRALHLSLAGALGSAGDPRVLVHHYEQAGQHERAAELALAAGRRAEDDLAFDQAAELYARALALGTGVAPAWGLHERIGRMLTLAGRAAEAVEHLAAAADALEATVPSDARSVALRRRAAEHYLRSGRYDAGLAALRASLRASAVRYPRTAPGAALSALARRALLALVSRLGSVWDPAYRFASGRGPAKTAAVSDREQEHLELYWSATVGLSLFDVVRAVDFQLRHTLLARRTGDPRHLARALATEAGILVWEGGARTRAHALQILDDAERLATSVGDPGVELLVLAGRSTVAFGARRFRESLSWCEQALRLGQTRHVGTPWETVNLEIGAITALVGMGELGRSRTRIVEAQQRAQEWGDIYGSVALRVGTVAFVWRTADDPDQVQRQVAEARAAAPLPPFQAYCAAYAEAQADIYAGNAARAWRATGAEWSRLRHRLLLKIEGVRLDLLETRARAALALAAQPGSQRAAMLRFVRRAAWRMAHQRADWILPSVSALRAGVAWLQGDRTSAITGLGEAAAGFDRLDMRMHAAAARLHLARLGVGEPVESCADAMRLLGAVHPPRLAAALVPGFPDLERAGRPPEAGSVAERPPEAGSVA